MLIQSLSSSSFFINYNTKQPDAIFVKKRGKKVLIYKGNKKKILLLYLINLLLYRNIV